MVQEALHMRFLLDLLRDIRYGGKCREKSFQKCNALCIYPNTKPEKFP